jgi:predicted metal-dependent HD superfamily phosphohydrolase
MPVNRPEAMIYANLIDNASSYVKEMFEKIPHDRLHFHNFHHTQNVAKRTKEISTQLQLNEEESFIVSLAAWFHDTGYLTGIAAGHEEISIEVLKKFYSEYKIPREIQREVEGCIRATRIGQPPANIREEVICDADTFHFGTKEFILTDELLKKEVCALSGDVPGDWDYRTLNLLMEHEYSTDYCKTILTEGKETNCRIFLMRTRKII